MFIHFDIKSKWFELEKSSWRHLTDFFEALSYGQRFLYSREKVNINWSIFFSHFLANLLPLVDVNIFTLLALKSKQIEPLSSAWRHFKDFYLLFLKVRDFDIVFK